MDPLTPQAFAAGLGCVIASITDVRTGFIRNTLTFPMIALGLVANLTLGQWTDGVLGLLVASAIHWPLWRLGVEKGGDLKLLMGVGALMGPWFALEASIWCAVLYIPVGIVVLAMDGKLGQLGRGVRWVVASAFQPEKTEAPEPTMLRTAPLIASAALASFLTPWVERLWGS